MSPMPVFERRGAVPRGIATDGPAFLSYGFRPFFLGAGLFAVIAMELWLGALTDGWPIGGEHLGPIYWHAHEMLFGYTTAALAGFMLTAIPNWTGRLPVSGPPLAVLAVLWLAGRVGLSSPEAFGLYPAIIADIAFLPVLAGIAAREIIAGRNWKNLKILAALAVLSAVNLGFHAALLVDSDPSWLLRVATSVYVLLITLVGGRIVPSFTRNWLARQGITPLPRPFGRIDVLSIALAGLALAMWSVLPARPETAVVALVAALAQVIRLAGWRGHRTLRSPLVAILHAAYAFVPLGLIAIALAALEWLSPVSALHVLTVGAIGNMTLAIMTRATLGHTGRELSASRLTMMAYLALLAAALLRPIAEAMPDQFQLVIALASGGWIAAFGLFVIEYGPILMSPRAQR